jgi:hypothetical protein
MLRRIKGNPTVHRIMQLHWQRNTSRQCHETLIDWNTIETGMTNKNET